jgi:hypothetical protein
MKRDLSEYVGVIVGMYPIIITAMLLETGVIKKGDKLNIDEIVDYTFLGLQNNESFVKKFIIFYNNNKQIIDSKLPENYTNITGSEYLSSGLNLFGKVSDIFITDKQNKTARDLANKNLENSKLSLEQQRLINEGKKIDAETALALAKSGSSGTKSNTGLYVGLGVGGVLILGLVVYLAVKK